MAIQESKLIICYIYRILMEESDEAHPLTAEDLSRRLKEDHRLTVDRRSIYNAIDTLTAAGVDIIKLKGSTHGCFIGSREFDLAELKMLVDAVQVSQGLSENKSGQLIEKLEHLTSRSQARQLQRQVLLSSRPKAKNENVFYAVDTIYTAIDRNRKISFQYAEWTPEKTFRLRKNGEIYIVSPYALIWDDENYYLVAWSDEHQEERHYRVDKMRHVECLEEERVRTEAFNPAAFEKKTFGMFSGEDAEVTLACDNHLAGVILDRFGSDIMLIPTPGQDSFHVRVPVTVSRQFFGWVTAIGSELRIIGPENVREAYHAYLEDILNHM